MNFNIHVTKDVSRFDFNLIAIRIMSKTIIQRHNIESSLIFNIAVCKQNGENGFKIF